MEVGIRALVNVKNPKSQYPIYTIITVTNEQVNEEHFGKVELLSRLASGQKIINVQSDGETILTNGSPSKYTLSHVIVIASIKSDTSKRKEFLCYCNDEVFTIDEGSLMGLAKQGKVANAKVLTDTKGRQWMSSIRGKYTEIDRRKSNEIVHGQGSHSGASSNPEQGRAEAGVDSDRAVNPGPQSDKRWFNGRRPDKAEILQRLKEVGCRSTNPATFISKISTATKANPFGEAVDIHSAEDYESMKCLTFDSGLAGIGVEGDGNIVSVFKHPDSTMKNYMLHAMMAAILQGGTKLDCYSIRSFLPSLYSRYGFIPAYRIKFNREFAPANWDYAKSGEPDIVFMYYCGDTIEEMVEKSLSNAYPSYNESQVPIIDDSDTKSAYELAQEFRDKTMELAHRTSDSKQTQPTIKPKTTTKPKPKQSVTQNPFFKLLHKIFH